MDDTLVFRELPSDNHEVSLLFCKPCTRVLRELNRASIPMFMFAYCGSGFSVPYYEEVGFLFSLGAILIKCVGIQ